MKCRQYHSLLEDYIDRELSPEHEKDLLDHLKNCRTCQRDLSELRRLKELLKHAKAPLPEYSFFRESERVILARATGSPVVDSIKMTSSTAKEKTKAEFFRSLISVAASLLLFASAIYLGSLPPNESFTSLDENTPVYVLAPTEQTKNYQRTVYASKDQIKQIKGMLLVGPPGSLSRFSQLYEFTKLVQ